MQTIELTLPNWTLCPLFNNDVSALTTEELHQLKHLAEWLNAEGYRGIPIDCEDLGFCHTNDISNLGNDCHKVTFPALAKQEAAK